MIDRSPESRLLAIASMTCMKINKRQSFEVGVKFSVVGLRKVILRRLSLSCIASCRNELHKHYLQVITLKQV